MLNHASISPSSSTFGTDLTLPVAAGSSSYSASAPASPERGDAKGDKNRHKEQEGQGKREIGAGGAVVTVFLNKSGLGSTLVKVSSFLGRMSSKDSIQPKEAASASRDSRFVTFRWH